MNIQNSNGQIDRQADLQADLQTYWPVDLVVSTPNSVVVRAQFRTPATAPGEPAWQDMELVIPRRACRGNRPSGAALMEAAGSAWRRLSGMGQRAGRAWGEMRVELDSAQGALLLQPFA